MAERERGVRTRVQRAVALAVAALVTIGAGREAAAQTEDDILQATHVQIAACGLAGGTAEVEVDRTANGVRATVVDCKGGLLDGAQCTNTSDWTACFPEPQTPSPRHQTGPNEATGPIDGIKPLDEPVETPVVVAEPSETASGRSEEPNQEPAQDPAGEETAAATPTPESGDDGDAPVVDDGRVDDEAPVMDHDPIVVADSPVVVAEPVLEDPAVSDDGAVAGPDDEPSAAA